MVKAKPKLESSWFYRRTCVFGVLTFCAVIVSYCTFYAHDDNLRGQIAMGAFSLSGLVLSAYLGIAAWDDKNWMRTRLAAQDGTETKPVTN